MSLADQIIEHGPWTRSDVIPGHLRIMMSADLNELRDELLELRRLRAAAEARERFTVCIDHWDDESHVECGRCQADISFGVQVDDVTLAELVRRADEHTEECR